MAGGNVAKQILISAELNKEMKAYCRSAGVASESALIRSAIASYIHPDVKDAELIYPSLQTMQRKVQEILDDMDILMKFLSYMHTDLLVYEREVPTDMRNAAVRSALGRHEAFMEGFSKSLSRGGNFFEKLLSRYYSEGEKG